MRPSISRQSKQRRSGARNVRRAGGPGHTLQQRSRRRHRVLPSAPAPEWACRASERSFTSCGIGHCLGKPGQALPPSLSINGDPALGSRLRVYLLAAATSRLELPPARSAIVHSDRFPLFLLQRCSSLAPPTSSDGSFPAFDLTAAPPHPPISPPSPQTLKGTPSSLSSSSGHAHPQQRTPPPS